MLSDDERRQLLAQAYGSILEGLVSGHLLRGGLMSLSVHHLKRKAVLPDDYRSLSLRFGRYPVEAVCSGPRP